MRKYKRSAVVLLTIIVLMILILDVKTASQGVNQGIELCFKTLIPAIFPFLIITAACNSLLLGTHFRVLHTLLRPCKLPHGAEMIFLVGLLGGYPLGAKLISDAYGNLRITKQDAQRMLMFCSNAGPAFLFGVIGPGFSVPWVPWAMWFVHILSAYIVGVLTSKQPEKNISVTDISNFNFTQTVTSSMKSMGNICTWVILFRIILVFFDKWFLWIFPEPLGILFTGILELSNGCTKISLIESTALRFLISSLIVTFGGFSVIMQTASIAPNLSIRYYLTGKFYQSVIALILSVPVMFFLNQRSSLMPLLVTIGLLFILFFVTKTYAEKNSSNLQLNDV